MIKSLPKRLWKFIKYRIPIYDLEPSELISDKNRKRSDLIDEIRLKRITVNKLNKKVGHFFYLIVTIVVFVVCAGITQRTLSFEKKVCRYYMQDFTKKLNMIALSDNKGIIEETEILIALSYIKDGEYNDAALLLSNLYNEDSEWLMALCYIRLKNEVAASSTLREIVKSKGKYSHTANQILKKYYN